MTTPDEVVEIFRIRSREWAADATRAQAQGDTRSAARCNARSDVWDLAADIVQAELGSEPPSKLTE